MMKIAILGAGSVGAILGKAWSKQGHEVIFRVRDINALKVQTLLAEIKTKRSLEHWQNPRNRLRSLPSQCPGNLSQRFCKWLGHWMEKSCSMPLIL